MTMVLTSCQFDDSDIWNKLNEHEQAIKDHENRILALEELCKQMNTNISALQTIVEALQNNDYVTSVTPVVKDGITIGYTITFSKSQPITIYHGKDGKDGANGQDGKDGKDSYTPQISVRQDEDGVYYWTLDGEWLLDDSGNKIKAVGTDGKDGQNGKDGADGKDGQNGADGKDAIIPQLKIENDYWHISYDNGTTWQLLGKATGEDGKNGQDGANGSDGKDGGIIIAVHETQTEVIFILFDGSSIVISKSSGSTENNDDEYIYFSDPTVESICLAHWDADENGKISYIEAKDVYEMSWHFENNEEIFSFTELQYFTNLSEVSFIGCTNLRSVVLPESVTSVCFFACYNLMKFNTPQMVSYLDMRECRQITSVVIPVNTSEFYFQNCFSLESVVLTDGLTTIPESAFMACWDLTSITIPESISSIGASAFRDCGSLRDIYCKSATPPACGEKVFCDYDGNPLDYCRIYVPTASVDAYKSTEGWSAYADNIVGYDF